MTGKSDGRMRLTVLGGFLGSGKTTWLRHQLHRGLFRDAFVVVNEAAETPVDDALLGAASRLAVLAGGCACCDGKADLIALLRKICDNRSGLDSRGKRLERIVLETSGLADPGPIVEAIRSDPILVHYIVVSGPDREDNTIIVIVRGYRAEDLRRLLRYFAGAAVGSRPPM